MQSIGQVLGFDVLGVHRVGVGLRVDVSAGDVRVHNKQRHYPVAWFSEATVPTGTERARVYFIDPEIGADTFADGSHACFRPRIDFDASAPRGVYSEGLVVVAVVKVPSMDRRSRGENGALGKVMHDEKAASMAQVRIAFEQWQTGAAGRKYRNDADFARMMTTRFENLTEGGIKNACTRWRHEKKSPC